MHKSHEHFNSQGNFDMPNMFRRRNRTRINNIQVHRFDRKFSISSKFPTQTGLDVEKVEPPLVFSQDGAKLPNGYRLKLS